MANEIYTHRGFTIRHKAFGGWSAYRHGKHIITGSTPESIKQTLNLLYPPSSSRGRTTIKNPSIRNEIGEASRRFESFSGHTATTVERRRVRQPTVFLTIGSLDAIAYTTVREGKVLHYQHEFRKNSRPLLAASSDGKFLSIVGGRFEFTSAGIEDRG